MASSRCIWMAFLLTFAVVAATLQPSAAARVQEEASSADQEASQPAVWRTRLPLPAFPCVPAGLPRFRFLPPCSNHSGARPFPSGPPSPPQPAECHTSLSGMAPCADFLTNASVLAPEGACCDGLKSLVGDAPICLCHVMNGDFGKLLPAPMMRLRMMALPRTCGVAVPFGTLRKCIRGPVPPMDAPPSGQ